VSAAGLKNLQAVMANLAATYNVEIAEGKPTLFVELTDGRGVTMRVGSPMSQADAVALAYQLLAASGSVGVPTGELGKWEAAGLFLERLLEELNRRPSSTSTPALN